MNSPPQSAQVNVLSDSATGQPPWKWLLYAGLNMLVYEAMSETLWHSLPIRFQYIRWY